jgi:hypothetical protein
MKALKEKRVSLRSFLRRGLVILSLFALVFASCGDSGGGDDGGNGGEPPVPPVIPPAPVLTRLNVVSQPTVNSFQGDRPVLTGLVVELAFDGGTPYLEYDISKFETVPPYANTASTTQATASAAATPVEMQVVLKGYTWPADKVMLPQVVKAEKIQFSNLAERKTWFSDQRPDFTGLYYNVITPTYYAPGGGGQQNPKSLYVQGTSGYPYADLSGLSLPNNKSVTVWIGKDHPSVGGSGIEGTDYYSTTFTVNNYAQATGISVKSMDWGDNPVFDDDWGRFAASATAATLDATKTLAELRKAKVVFEVFYNDAAGTSREITLDEFIANNAWFKDNNLADSTLFDGATTVGSDGRIAPSTALISAGGNWNTPGLLNFRNEDAENNPETWTVFVEYLPIRGSTTATPTAIHINIPIWWMDTSRDGVEFRVTKKPGDSLPTITGDSPATVAADITNDDLARLNDRWKLEGVYTNSSSREPKYKVLSLTKQMFYSGAAGQFGTGGFASVYAGSPDATYDAALHLSASGFGYSSGDIARDYPLPLFYRGSAVVGAMTPGRLPTKDTVDTSEAMIFVNLMATSY